MNQLSMFSDIPDRLTWLKGEIVFSLDYDQAKILRNILRLYNDGAPFDADVTYSKGVFYKNLPHPKMKFDLDPQYPDVIKASADSLPLENDSVHSIMFDPPFKASNSTVQGIVEQRFTAFPSVKALWGFYETSLREFWRVLDAGGIAVIKCQDTVSSGKNHFSHYEIEKYAREIGFAQLDLFVLGNKHVLISSTWKTQRHARKSHSYFLVFQKPVPKTNKGK